MGKRRSLALSAALLAVSACGGSQSEPAEPQVAAQPPAQAEQQITPKEVVPAPVEAKGNPSNDLIPRDVFFGDPDRAGVQISPDGKSLSWLAPVDGVLNVWVAPTGDLSKAKAVTGDKTRPVRQYFWAFDNQHIVYMQDTGGNENWHVFSVDLAKGATKDLTPKKKVQARVEAVSYKHPREIVIGLNDRNPQLHDLYLVDLETGAMKLLEQNPGFLGYSLDDDFDVQLAITMTPDGGMKVLEKAPQKKAKKAKKDDKAAAAPSFPGWKELYTVGPEDSLSTRPIDFDKSGRHLYMWDSRGRNTSALVSLDLKTGKTKVLAEDPKADGSGVFLHPTKKTVEAVSFTYEKRKWKILDKRMKKDYAALTKLSDGEPAVTSTSLDLKTWVVAYLVDDGPVRYYLYDHKQRKGSFLFTNRTALEKLQLAKMHPEIVKSRDGLDLVDYLSLPPASDPDADGKPASALPMVLLVHGGPWARDDWGYNPLHQLLANRGYAVLSVNYRGSTGLGKAFLNAGNMEWAGKMHDDLIDSVNWAVAQGIAQKDKVCIMGGSYGGYATLVGLTFTPDVFACGVNIVGPSNILTLLASIPPYWKPMQDVFKTRVGDWTTPEGKKMLIDRSPLTHVNAIKAPLLIGQGANDPRVKQAEADQIVNAMQAKKIPVSYILFPDEGHGFARVPNKLAFFAAAEAFLSAHLGGQYEPATAAQLKGTTMKVEDGVYGIPGFPALMSDLGQK